MIGIFRIFFGAKGTRPFLVIFCLVLAGFAEALSWMTFLPAVTQLAGGTAEGSSALNGQVVAVLGGIGIEASLGNLLLIVVAGLVLKALLAFAALSYVGFAVAKVATGLRRELIAELMNARWGYFVDQKIGRIANVISNDATRAGTAYMMAAKFVAYIVQGLAYAAVAIALSWKLAAGGLVVGLIMTSILNVLVRISKRAGYKQTDRTSELVTYLSDILANIKPIKAMERRLAFIDFFNAKIKKLKRSLRVQVVSVQARVYGEEIILAVCLGFGLYMAAVVWKIPMPELVIMGIVFYQMVNIIGKMQKFLQSAVKLESAYWAVTRMIEESSRHPEPNPGTRTPTLAKGCTMDNIVFGYRGEKPVLNDISLEVPANQITVLRGTSGMGKTTLVDLLIGLYQPDSGRILVDGVPLTEIDLSKWRRMIGYVPQDATLFHDTILSNITLGDEDIVAEQVEEALAQAGATAFVDRLPDGVMSIVGERGARLSGGERQRLALARALVTKPALLVLDEVTSALDPDTERRICHNIQSLAEGYTILAITHRPIWVEIASRVYQVEGGKVTRERRPAKRQKVSL
jgi:ATP-binding cassette subfamily C protein